MACGTASVKKNEKKNEKRRKRFAKYLRTKKWNDEDGTWHDSIAGHLMKGGTSMNRVTQKRLYNLQESEIVIIQICEYVRFE